MGGVGSDIAVDAADIALVDDEVKEIPHLVALSKRMMTTIKINMTFFHGTEFPGYHIGNYRKVKSGCRSTGA